MIQNKFYQEENSSTFTHDGQRYHLNKVLALSQNINIEEVQVEKLEWILEFNKPCASCENVEYHESRVQKSDLEYPILIGLWHEKLVVLDGIHRLEKAKELNIKSIKSKLISDEILEKSKKE